MSDSHERFGIDGGRPPWSPTGEITPGAESSDWRTTAPAERSTHRSELHGTLDGRGEARLAARSRGVFDGGEGIGRDDAPLRGAMGARLEATLAALTTAAAEALKGLLPGTADTEEPGGGVERLVLRATGEVTPTEEYVFHHGVERRSKAGGRVPDAVRRGEWTPELRAEFVAAGSREAVTAALERLSEAGHLEAVEPASEDDWEGPYWRLTATGRAVREELAGRTGSPSRPTSAPGVRDR